MKKNLFIIITCAAISLSTLCAGTKTVKIGYYSDGNPFFNIGKTDSAKYGFGYDYIQLIASYTGWDYEYVYGTYAELYKKLLNNELDLLPAVGYSQEIQGKILFPEDAMVTEKYYLYVKTGDNSISEKDYSLLNFKKVGVQKGTYQEEQLKKILKLNGLKGNIIEFDNRDTMRNAFINNEISAIVDSDIGVRNDWESIFELLSFDSYLAVSNRRPDLLNEIETAVAEIKTFDPSYFKNLWKKFNPNSITNRQLTDAELDYLDTHKTFRIGYLSNYFPFCDINSETGEPEGFFKDFINLSMAKNSITDVELKFISFANFDDMVKALNNDELDAIFPVPHDFYDAEKNNYFPTEPVVKIGMCIVYKNILGDDWTDSVAVTDSFLGFMYMSKNYPLANFTRYRGREGCLYAVQQGAVKGALLMYDKAQSILYKNRNFRNLKILKLPIDNQISFGTKRDNLILLSILNKCFSAISEQEKTTITTSYAVKEMQFTTEDFIKSYIWFIVTIVTIIFILLMCLAYTINKIREYINYDSLTHLLNRKTLNATYTSIQKRADKTNSTFCVMILDLDDFKHVNDTYGHACGDEVLKQVAKIIMHSISSMDYAFRWGGEEILILFNTNANYAYNSSERIRKTIEKNSINCNGTEIKITATLGLSVYRQGMSFQDMFTIADENLYKGKRQGKNTIIL